MATDLDTLIVRLAADTAQMRGELAKATSAMAREMQKQAKEVEKVNASLARVGNTIKNSIMGALAGLSVSNLVRMGAETMKWADDLKAVADRIGVSTDSLQELIGAGRQVNISAAEMTKGMESFAVKFAEAASGKGRGVEALKALGVTARDASGQVKSFDRVLDEVADSIRQFDRPSQLAIAKSMFGDEGALKFLDLLGQGKTRLDDLRKAARDAGVVISEDMVNAGERFNKTLERLEDRARTGLRTAFLELAPILDDLASKIDKVTQRADVLRRFGTGAIGPMLLQEMFPATTDAARRGMARVLPKSLSEGLFDKPASTGFEGRRAAEDASMRAMDAARGGTKVANFDKGGASQLESFRKLMEDLKAETEKARAALDPYRASIADLNAKLAKMNATLPQSAKATEEFNKAWSEKATKAMKEIVADTELMGKLTTAELMGRRDIVIALELEAQIRKQFGEEEAKRLRPQIEAQAKLRAEMERNAQLGSSITSALESGASQMTDAFGAFFDENRNGWEEMGKAAISTLQAIAKEMIMLTLIKPAAAAATEGIMGWLGLATKVAGVAGGFSSGALPLMHEGFQFRAEGGPVQAGMPYIVGEKRPELFVPDVSGTIVPRVPGGGTVNLYGSPDSTVRVAEVEAALRQLGMKVRRIDGSIENRAVGAVVDMKRRGGSAANVFA